MDALLQSLPGALLIFALRIGDVSIGTVRTLLMVQGRRLPATALAVVESTIWVLAVSRVIGGGGLDNPLKVVGYACGFAAGTLVGMTVERMLAVGKVLVRIISRDGNDPLRKALHDGGFGATTLQGIGRDGPVQVHFVVAPRRRLKAMLRVIRSADPHAFITHEPVNDAIGGFLPSAAEAAAGRT
jgi:uncharacterized protein YebE (UPF0316 family)